jgi:putative hydrolase of the HAD superfamily
MHLFFDLDNTLWDFDTNSYNVLSSLYSTFELQQKLNTDFKSFHDFYVKKNDELWHLYYFNKIEKSELRYKRFYDSLLHFGLDDVTFSKTLAEEYVRISPYSKALKPGCVETLDTLHSTFDLHIITNGFSEIQNIKIDNCGLRKYFKQIIISEDYKLTKPHIDIFRLAEKMAGAKTEQCVMIGDNWVSDIEGAIGAGWKAVYYNERETTKSNDVKQIASLSDLSYMFTSGR